jgi:quercetin dioxygenase-like cupin family protein
VRIIKQHRNQKKELNMTANLSALDASRAALNRLPFLAGAALHFHLKDELEKLRKQESWQRSTGRSSRTLAKYPDFHIVLVLMKPGAKMNEHHVDGRVSLQVIQGRVRVHLPDRDIEIRAGDLLALEYGLLHHIEALEESAFLISISWPGGTKEQRHARYAIS